jgi:hypothetical protein
MHCSVSKQMRIADKSNQAYTGNTLLLAIAGSAVLLLSSLLSNRFIQLGNGQRSPPQQDQESLREDVGTGIGHFEFEKRPELAELRFEDSIIAERKAPPTITGDNVYVTWWTNDTANHNEEVLFSPFTDGGTSVGDKINLSNTTDSDSWKVEIDSDADSVVVTWWETNATDETPVMRISNDNRATFGPLLGLAINGTLSTAEPTQ